MAKIRACGDLKYGCVNMACAARTAITLPTWGHIGKICIDVADSNRAWPFFKVGHKSAYKNLPLNPDQADACITTLRNPSGGLRCGFRLNTLLFRAVAAALHYNCVSRIVALSANLLLGIPTVNYFDDLGSPAPTSISEAALATLTDFSHILGIILKDDKTELGRRISFLGLSGHFPGPVNDMTPSVDLADGGKLNWAEKLEAFLARGSIAQKELESVTGRMSFSQTSIFGRWGVGTTQPLYRKSNSQYCQADLSVSDRLTFQRRAGILRQELPRRVVPRRRWADLIIYTDAAAETIITAILVCDRDEFIRTGEILSVRTDVGSADWVGLFLETNSIYGLELVDIVLTTSDISLDLDNRSIAYYIDNNNAISALVKADTKQIVIAILAILFRALVAKRGIAPWFDRVGSWKNIADLTTRLVELPYSVTYQKILPFANPPSDGEGGHPD